MEPLQKEIAELKGFVTDLKNDRTAQKEKEQRDSWTKYVSMTLICLAVLAAIATLKGGGFTTRTLKELNEATYQQAHASDQWAFFQAKSIKQNLYEIELDPAGRLRLPYVSPGVKDIMGVPAEAMGRAGEREAWMPSHTR